MHVLLFMYISLSLSLSLLSSLSISLSLNLSLISLFSSLSLSSLSLCEGTMVDEHCTAQWLHKFVYRCVVLIVYIFVLYPR